MEYFKQETDYTCGPACVRMMLSNFGIESFESELEYFLETKPNCGTHYDQFDKVVDKYNLQKQQGEASYSGGATLEQLKQLQKLTEDGWICILAYSLDVPHYSIFTEFNGNHVFLMDPFRGQRVSEQARKFLKHWKVVPKEFEKLAKQMNLDFTGIRATYGWWIAFKK